MIRVAALTSGQSVPSARFRVRQHIEPLGRAGIRVREYWPRIDKYADLPLWPRDLTVKIAPHFPLWLAAKAATRLPGLLASWGSDVTWLERELIPGFPSLEPLLRGPVVFDVDDAIWLNPPFARSAVARIAARAEAVIAGNEYLADWFSRHAREVHIVPTAVDTERFAPPRRDPDGRFVIGWTGSASTIRYLEGLQAVLGRFLREFREADLLVIADGRPSLPEVPPAQLRYVAWSPHTEASVLSTAHVGIMPLEDNEWTRGKCSFKMLQYMACGQAVVASPVGMNTDILGMGELGVAARTPDDWFDALAFYCRNRDTARTHGSAGRRVAEQRFSRPVVTNQLARIFRSLVTRESRPES